MEEYIDLQSNEFPKSFGIALSYPITSASRVEILENGDQIFSSMLNALEQATSTIFFETFIYWDGNIAKRFSEVLSRKAQEGVKCFVLLDGFGCKSLNSELIKMMKNYGVQVEIYNSFSFKNIRSGKSWRHRTHRKIMVVDNTCAFIGGVGIADKWTGNARNPDEFRDLHFKLEGDILGQLLSAFLDNWLEFPGELIPLKYLSIKEGSKKKIICNVVMSTPTHAYDSLKVQLNIAFKHARSSILIVTPYFIPGKEILQNIVDCAQRGVKVEIIVPGANIDKAMARYASRHLWGRCLEGGVKIFEFQPTFIHSKYCIVDDSWCSVGSANFDILSLHVNEEANLNIFDQEFSERLKQVYLKDKMHSKEVTLQAWRSRKMGVKLLDFLASSFKRFL